MREERLDSQIKSAHNLRVRAIQSTQVDLGRLEQDVPDACIRGRGNGNILRGQTSLRVASKQPGSLTNCCENKLRKKHSAIYGQDKIQRRSNLGINFAKNKDYGHERSLETDQGTPKRPVFSSSLSQLSDDIDEKATDKINVCDRISDFCPLNLDNSAKRYCRSRAGKSRRCTKSGKKCELIKRKQAKASSGTRVIRLPPNSVVKITSESSLRVRKGQKKKSAAKLYSSHSNQVASRTANESNSSRYRVTPCPAVNSSSEVPQHASLSFTSKRSPSLTSASAMGPKPPRKTSSRVSSCKSHRQMRTGGRSMSSSRRKRSRSWYSNFSGGSLFNRSRKRRRQRQPSVRRTSRVRQMSSPRRGRSLASSIQRLSNLSVSAGRRPRGRPQCCRHRKSRSKVSVGKKSHLTQRISNGLLNRVSHLWRACSISKSGLGARAPSSSHSSTISRTQSWVSKLLPKSRSKYQKRLRARKSKKRSAKRRASRTSSVNRNRKEAQSSSAGFCSIM